MITIFDNFHTISDERIVAEQNRLCLFVLAIFLQTTFL